MSAYTPPPLNERDRAFLASMNAPYTRLANADIAAAWKAGEDYKLIPTVRHVADSSVDTLFRTGELATCLKGMTRILKNTGMHDKDDCRQIAFEAAIDALRQFNGQGDLVGYVSYRVWVKLSQFLRDPQSGDSAGVVGVPDRCKGAPFKVALDAPRNERAGDAQAYVVGKQSSGTRADELEYAPGSEFDNPAHIVDRHEYVSTRAGLRHAIDCVRDPELKRLLRYLVKHRYDFRHPRLTTHVVEEYRRSDAFLPRKRPSKAEMEELRDAALVALREFVHFEIHPEGGACGGRNRGFTSNYYFGPARP